MFNAGALTSISNIPKLFITLILLLVSMQVNGALINLTTDSPIEATYNLSIVTELEYAGFDALTQGNIIDLRGLGDSFGGTYYIESVNHSFGNEGYTYNFLLDKQGSAIVDDNGDTDISLMFVNYDFTAYDFLQENSLLTRVEFSKTVPEPTSLALMSLGLIGLAFYRR